jgi:hypothetical protein
VRPSHRLAVQDVADLPLREVSGLTRRGPTDMVAVGDHDPIVLLAGVDAWPPTWRPVDLSALELPEGGTQFEAVVPTGGDTVLILQEEPARVLHVALSAPAVVGVLLLEVPEGHALREAWMADRSSRGESLLLLNGGHLLVVKEKNPAAVLEFGPVGEAAVGWRRGDATTPPSLGDHDLTTLATWWLSDDLADMLEDVSDATIGPDGRLYLLSDKSSSIIRLADVLAPGGGPIEADAVWHIEGKPENAEGLVILDDGTPLVALDTKKGQENLLRLERLPL